MMIINDTLTDRFVYVVAGTAYYGNETDSDIVKLFARLRAEGRLTKENWHTFGYEVRPKGQYFRDRLDGDIDLVFVPQTSDEEEWKRICFTTMGEIFPENPTNVTKTTVYKNTWHIAKEDRNYWMGDIPRFFSIYNKKDRDYNALIMKDLELFRYGERYLDALRCVHYTTGTTLKRDEHRGKEIFEKVQLDGESQDLIPVIGMAKIVFPYAVKLEP
jgi:hypothetical protein